MSEWLGLCQVGDCSEPAVDCCEDCGRVKCEEHESCACAPTVRAGEEIPA